MKQFYCVQLKDYNYIGIVTWNHIIHIHELYQLFVLDRFGWVLWHINHCWLFTTKSSCLVGWDCRIHQLHLCRGVRLPQWMSWIWYKTIWWWGSHNAGSLGRAEYPFTAIAPKSTLREQLIGSYPRIKKN